MEKLINRLSFVGEYFEYKRLKHKY